MPDIIVVPCSGIGKVLGLLARETALETINLCPNAAKTACLANLVADYGGKEKVNGKPCVTIDGCSAMCAAKGVEYAGGDVKHFYRVMDEMKNHRGKKAGDGTSLTKEGWEIVESFAAKIAKDIEEISKD